MCTNKHKHSTDVYVILFILNLHSTNKKSFTGYSQVYFELFHNARLSSVHSLHVDEDETCPFRKFCIYEEKNFLFIEPSIDVHSIPDHTFTHHTACRRTGSY